MDEQNNHTANCIYRGEGEWVCAKEHRQTLQTNALEQRVADAERERDEAIDRATEWEMQHVQAEAEVQRHREALEGFNVTIKVVSNDLSEQRSLCWKGDGDGISDTELRAEVLRWFAALTDAAETGA